MFGSKIRSWMENHIVRPRKRGNKNKHNSGNPTSLHGGNCDSFKKETLSHQGNDLSTTTPSKLASSTIGTANSNNTNYYCSSTKASPVRRREVSPIQNHSRYGWQSPDSETITSPKSDNYLYAPQQHHRFKPQQQNSSELCKNSGSTLSEPKNTAKSLSYHQQPTQNNSSSSFSSLSWSTGSKEHNGNNIEKQNIGERKQKLQTPLITFHLANEINHYDDSADTVHYEEIQTNILRYPESVVGHNFCQQERPKSEQLTTFNALQKHLEFSEKHSIDDSLSVRYGKLLPSRIQPGSNECLTNKHILAGGSAECLPYNSNQQQRGTGLCSSFTSTAQCARLRNGMQTLNGNTLSSPESAYSTGYSTDGTSPGACHHPPEYYINMRTGTHYFPKNVNSLAIEAQRYKSGLNKIEEMSPIDPLPKVSFAAISGKPARPESYNEYENSQGQKFSERSIGCHSGSPLPTHNTFILPTLQGFESSSPRQRSRIRTNPWYSTNETSLQQPLHTSATSSTISSRSSTSVFAQIDSSSSSNIAVPKFTKEYRHNPFKDRNIVGDMIKCNAMYDSSSSEVTEEEDKQSTLSLTEVDSRQKAYTANTIRTKCHSKGELSAFEKTSYTAGMVPVAYLDAPLVSDEDATLNEMMGKFDESYVYEKETDILSDSDATNCPSELDTAELAGDECDTDELLDIDFIDTSMHDFSERKDIRLNIENLSYANSKTTHELSSKNKRTKKSDNSSSHRRRKRLIKTRKKNNSEYKENVCMSPLRQSRETRSVGGTPISLRRNGMLSKGRQCKMSFLTTRASSLVFPHDQGRKYMTVAESNKALAKADLEADVKYRQLIQEAESILVTLKSSVQSIPRETPVSSPRRINPLVNKRIEILKSFEGRSQQPLQRNDTQEHDLTTALNKRIELLKCESSSAPNSPKNVARFSPSKTHITNFMNQIERKTAMSLNDPQRAVRTMQTCDLPLGHKSPSKSPMQRRSAQKNDNSRHLNNLDSDLGVGHLTSKLFMANSTIEQKMDLVNHNFLPEITRVLLPNNIAEDYTNHNLKCSNNYATGLADSNIDRRYCPQSEPLKRKIYKGSSSFERIKQSFDLESDLMKRAFACNLRHERSNTGTAVNLKSSFSRSSSQDLNHIALNAINKKQLILDTLSSLKQNLEDQSVELNGFNAI